jgi:uncharacterized membrane protein
VASLFVLVITAVVLRIAGWLGVAPLTSWRAVGRTSSSVMLLFTGSSHFSSMKDDFVAMLPEPVPKDVRIIYLTGLAEIAGAIGLLIPNTRRAAGMALVVQLAAMFPRQRQRRAQGHPAPRRAADGLVVASADAVAVHGDLADGGRRAAQRGKDPADPLPTLKAPPPRVGPGRRVGTGGAVARTNGTRLS